MNVKREHLYYSFWISLVFIAILSSFFYYHQFKSQNYIEGYILNYPHKEGKVYSVIVKNVKIYTNKPIYYGDFVQVYTYTPYIKFPYVYFYYPKITISKRRIELLDLFVKTREWLYLKCELNTKACAILNSVVFADKSMLDKDLERSFNNAGISHIAVASGFNIMLMVAAINMLLKLTLKRNAVIFMLATPIVALFFYGLTASTLRAGLLSYLYIYSQINGRNPSLSYMLLVTYCIEIIIFAHYLYDISFQLSYLSCFAIYYADKIKLNNPLIKGLILNTCIWIATMPIIFIYFGYVNVRSILANILLAYWVGSVSLLYILYLIMPFKFLLAELLNFYINYIYVILFIVAP